MRDQQSVNLGLALCVYHRPLSSFRRSNFPEVMLIDFDVV